MASPDANTTSQLRSIALLLAFYQESLIQLGVAAALFNSLDRRGFRCGEFLQGCDRFLRRDYYMRRCDHAQHESLALTMIIAELRLIMLRLDHRQPRNYSPANT